MREISPTEFRERADALATVVFKCVEEGKEQDWVSGLIPESAVLLNAALDAYCLDDGERLADVLRDED